MRMRAPRILKNQVMIICCTEKLKLDATSLELQLIIISNSPTNLDKPQSFTTMCPNFDSLIKSRKTELKCPEMKCTNETTKMTGHTDQA